MKNLSLVTLLVISLVLFATFVENVDAYYSSVPPPAASAPAPLPSGKHLHLRPGMPLFCPWKCKHRCSKNPRELCKKLCMHCCNICKCVPTGPKGDKNVCPCYRDMKGKKGRSKCP